MTRSINGDQRFNRDPTGRSGAFLGHAVDGRTRWNVNRHVDATLGYSHWTNGGFVRGRQHAALAQTAVASDFVYLELSFNVFEQS